MNTLAILLTAGLVTLLTIGTTIAIGLREAADPVQSSPEELTAWEEELVAEEREQQLTSH